MINIESKGVPILAWVEGVQVEDQAREQLQKCAALPVVGPHIAVMPDVHLGYGATVGSVIPTRGAIIPSAVGVDIGCGMMATRLGLRADQLPDNLAALRTAIEAAVPHGRTNNGGPGDRGAWSSSRVAPNRAHTASELAWVVMADEYRTLVAKHPKALAHNTINHLGTLGGGNHFVEICLDENQDVWVMLHSGSRGVGNRIGSYFIELAKNDMIAAHGNMPEDTDLCYLTEGTEHFDDYVAAVGWAQNYARINRDIMMANVLSTIARTLGVGFGSGYTAVNCHHNYVERETHFGESLFITRKGAVNAAKGTLGIIPGSMGAKSFIVRGLGNPESFNSCSHGAGRMMSRNEAKSTFSVADHELATKGVECRKDISVIDETPAAYKPIDLVMNAQRDLVEVVHTLKQVLCVKG